MSQNESNMHPFIQFLHQLAKTEDRAALAHLRRGLGKKPGAAPEMFPYVVPWLPTDVHPQEEAVYYTIAALFARHPSSTPTGNMGDHMAAARENGREDAVERRFVTLLAAHPEDFSDFLRQTVSFLASKEIPVNWNQLFRDMRYWSHPDYGENVRKRWATAFWRFRRQEETSHTA